MADNKNYWKENISLIIKCLTIWFIVSYGCSIIFVEVLNNIRLGGYKLGFWFAQQGSIYTFVILIFYYVYEIDKIDKRYGVADR
jgi:putative solute:sodium symporter small subunit|tara:strand:- start:1459 stop:1710 length:252 start_codon:yes stop_codon:yes gene_type:complete